MSSHTMDFASLVGSSASLAKQLELKWFYHWEQHDLSRRPSSSATASSTTSSGTNNDTKRRSTTTQTQNNERRQSSSDDPSDSTQYTVMDGTLVRKRCHSMPFLRRNIIIGGGGRGSNGCSSWYIPPRRREDKDNRKSGSSSAAIIDAAPPLTKQYGKRKRVTGERRNRNDIKKQLLARGNNNPTLTVTTTTTAKQLESTNESCSKPSSYMRTSAFQSYVQLRQAILKNIPAKLHHDEMFVLERMKEEWIKGDSHLENSTGGDIGDAGDDVAGSGIHNNDVSQEGQVTEKGATVDANHPIVDGGDNIEQGVVDNSFIILPYYPSLPTKEGDIRFGSSTTTTALPSQNQQVIQQQAQQLPPAYFHYLYMQDNNTPATFVEELDGRVCPISGVDCKSNEGLLEHCIRYHGMTKFVANNNIRPVVAAMEGDANIEAALGEEGQFHVILRGVPPNSSSHNTMNREDFVYISPRSSSPRGRCSTPKPTSRSTTRSIIPFLQRHPSKTAILDPATRFKKLLALQANDAPASTISAYLPGVNNDIPIRQYFHARTSLPMLSWDEWNEDSDGEADDEWLREMSTEMLDEFEDVSGMEKEFFKLWNKFMRSKYVVADRDMPRKCHEFVRGHVEELREGGLRLNLVLHLFNLWDFGIISSKRILSSLSIFDGAETGKDSQKMEKVR